MNQKFKYATAVVAMAVLTACGGGSDGADDSSSAPAPQPVGALAKYIGNYSYCDQDHTKYSVSITDAGDGALNTAPTEVSYQNSDCTGSVLATYSWTAPARVTLSSTSVATVSGGGLPSSLTIDKIQATASNINIRLVGPGVSGNCVSIPSGRFCYDSGPFDATTQAGFYLSGGKLYEMVLNNGVYVVGSVYSKN